MLWIPPRLAVAPHRWCHPGSRPGPLRASPPASALASGRQRRQL